MRLRFEPGYLNHQLASRLNSHPQIYWAMESQAKILNPIAPPYDEQAFSPLDANAGMETPLCQANSIFVVWFWLCTGTGTSCLSLVRPEFDKVTKLWLIFLMLINVRYQSLYISCTICRKGFWNYVLKSVKSKGHSNRYVTHAAIALISIYGSIC